MEKCSVVVPVQMAKVGRGGVVSDAVFNGIRDLFDDDEVDYSREPEERSSTR